MRGGIHAGRMAEVSFPAQNLPRERGRSATKTRGTRLNVVTGLPVKLPRITLTHGQVIWLLLALGHSEGVAEQTFYEYIKSLRKLGIPFGHGAIKPRAKALANYHYCDIMELAVTLALRVYHVVPDSILRKIIRNRTQLRRLYYRAYEERESKDENPFVFPSPKGAPIILRGRFLDLGIRFSGGHLAKFGPPRLLSPAAAMALSARRMLSGETSLPLGVSALAEQVVALALAAPLIRRGPPAQTDASDARERRNIK